MKYSLAKKALSIILMSVMLLSSIPTIFAEESNATPDGTQAIDAPNGEIAAQDSQSSSENKDFDLIELANGLANGTHTYYEPGQQNILINNQSMSLKYGLVADSDEIYVKNLSNTKGQAYIQNTFDVYVKTEAGDKFYASNSITGASVNIYRYGYYYYENRIEGQTFLTDIIPTTDHCYNVDLTSVAHKNAIKSYGANPDGTAYFIAANPANDVYFGYTTKDSSGQYLKAADYDYIEIKVKAESAGAAGQLFIAAGNENSYNATQSTSFTFKNDGEWHTYRLPLTSIKNYEGELKCVRFDIDATANTRVDIEYIKIFKAQNVGIDPALSIQRSFLTYSDKLHHLIQFSAANEIDGIAEVGMVTQIEADTVNSLVVKDAGGLKYTLDSVDWSSAEYVAFDIKDVGIFGYILPYDNKSGGLKVTLTDGIYIITQTLPVTSFSPSEKGTRNAKDIFFGQRIYTDENHDFSAFITEAEIERHPLTEENITIIGNSAFGGYDPLYGFYKFSIGGTSFNAAYYDHPNRQYNVRFTINGDSYDRELYIRTCCTSTGGLECAVLLDDKDMLLPIPMEVAKNFSGDGENTVYNIDDAAYSETFFPMLVNAGEARTYNVINLYQNWGQYPLKQISSIQFHTPYYHLSTGVTETNCITLFPVCGPGLPDHRAMSAPFWTGQPQHNSGGGHSFLRYTDADGNYSSSQNSSAFIDSYGPTYCDITLGYECTDGKISAQYTHTEMPQIDENRAYYEMRYTFNEDISFKDFAHDFVFYKVTDNNAVGVYEYVGYLDQNNMSQVVDAIDDKNMRQEFVLGDECPYFSFFCMPDWNRASTSAQGYTNLAMLFKDWTVICDGKEIETELYLINTKDYLTLSMNISEVYFKAGDSITINAILMPWGSQQMEDDPANRLDNAQTAIYNSPHYSDPLPDGSLYMDKNVRDVRENTLLDPLTVTALENCKSLNSAFVPKVESTNGKSATFTLSGGHDNNAVRIYGFNKLTVPKIEELVDGEWVEYAVNSKSAPDTKGYGYNYDGYMVHYDGDGKYSYSFVTNMTDAKERTFRISAEEDFKGWKYDPSDFKSSPMNVYLDANTIKSKASSTYFSSANISDDGSYVSLEIKPGIGESYINLYSGDPNITTGKYIVYKYRIPKGQDSTGYVEFWTSTERTGAGGSDYISIDNKALQKDGEWHVMVVDITRLKLSGCTFAPNTNGTYSARYLRIDPTNGTMPNGGIVDVAYIGLSDSISEIIAANKDVESIDLINSDKKTFTAISTSDYTPDTISSLTLESSTIHRGDEVTLSLSLENNPGLSYIRIVPKYDTEVFTLKHVQNGTVMPNLYQVEGSFLWMQDQNFTEDGALATFTFEVKPDAPVGKYEIEIILLDSAGKTLSEVPIITYNSITTVLEHEYGDCNGDGIVNSLDIVALRKYLTNYEYVTDGADANGDGYVNTVDLTLLRQYLASYDYDNDTPTIHLGKQD